MQKICFTHIEKGLGVLLGLTLGLCACGAPADESADTQKQQTTEDRREESADAQEQSATETEQEESADMQEASAVENEREVTIQIPPTKVSVTYSTTTDEITADDGTVLVTQKFIAPTVSIDGADDIAAKINNDLTQEEFPASASVCSETAQWAKELYEENKGDESYSFMAFSLDRSAKTTRMDDSVISFEATDYEYSGGAHGNYGSIGYNYSTKTGAPIPFDGLAADPAAFRAAALGYLKELALTPSYALMMFPSEEDSSFAFNSEDSVESTLFAEDKWFFSNSGLTFISDPYALGPYASGTIYFTIPYEEAMNMGLKEEYSYAGNYTQTRYFTSSYDAASNETITDGSPEYFFDLNGDGTKEGIAFYGIVYTPQENPEQDGLGTSKFSLYIDGTEFGGVMDESLDLTNGFPDNRYVLYDLNPSDPYVEIGVPFMRTDQTDSPFYTYFFRYTPDSGLFYVGNVEGNVSTNADVDFETFQ